MPAENKTGPTQESVDAFIEAVPNATRRTDAQTLVQMMQDITKEEPVMWGASIIGFGQYHYRYESGREGDTLNVGFSPRKANMVLYVLGSIDDDDPILEALGKYKRGSACLYVNKLADVDLGQLKKLIRKSYRATLKKYGAA